MNSLAQHKRTHAPIHGYQQDTEALDRRLFFCIVVSNDILLCNSIWMRREERTSSKGTRLSRRRMIITVYLTRHSGSSFPNRLPTSTSVFSLQSQLASLPSRTPVLCSHLVYCHDNSCFPLDYLEAMARLQPCLSAVHLTSAVKAQRSSCSS